MNAPSTISTEIENIADALNSCTSMAHSHTESAQKIMFVVTMLTATLITILAVVFLFPFILRNLEYKLTIPDTALYVFLAIYVLTFSVLMAIYRLHIGEAARLQHYIVGFMRIRVAGSNLTSGYQSEVREALTHGAFDYQLSSDKKGKVQNPIPGHPGTELATTVANKVIDAINRKSKRTRSNTEPEATNG